jgi:hypothetical protein
LAKWKKEDEGAYVGRMQNWGWTQIDSGRKVVNQKSERASGESRGRPVGEIEIFFCWSGWLYCPLRDPETLPLHLC